MYSIEFWLPILAMAAINAIVALGVYITLLSGQASVAHAAFMGIGAYAGAILTTKLGLPLPLALLAGTLAGTTAGALLSLVTMRMTELVVAITTVGFGEVMVVLALNVNYIGGAEGMSGIPLVATYWMIAVAFVAAGFFTWRFDMSRIGLAARAIRDDRTAADAMGVDVAFVRVATFAIGAGMSGFAGVLWAHYTTIITPTSLSFFQSFFFKMYVLFGGSYVFWGPIAGAIILTLLPEVFAVVTSLSLSNALSLRYVLFGLVVILTLMLRREGLIRRRPTGRTSQASAVLRRLRQGGADSQGRNSLPPGGAAAAEEQPRVSASGRDR